MAKGKKPHNRVDVQPPGKPTDVAAWKARILDYVSVCRTEGMAAQKPLEGLDDEQLLFLVESWPDIPELRLYKSSITDNGLKVALVKTKQLHTLAISEDEGITDQGLEYISQVPSLKELHLYWGTNFTGKGISHLKKLKNLESLSLPHSRDIEAMLDVVAQMRDLKRLGIPDSSPIPRELSGTEDPQAILEAWRNGEDFLDFRIAIVGMVDVGKTWLRRRCFSDEVIPEDEPRKETPDIDLINEHDVEWTPRPWIERRPRRTAPHLWDFGGQLIKHGIHELFFAENDRTLYVLVLSATRPLQRHRDDNGDETGNGLNYWLKMIKHFAGSRAPVLIVVTQCDKPNRNREVDEIIHWTPEDFRKRWDVNVIAPVIDGISACDKAPERIEPLKAAIEKGLGFPWHQRMPEGFRRLRAHVESKLEGKSVVSVEEFRSWCSECDVHDGRRQDTYLRILHELGTLFYFGVTDAESEPQMAGSDHESGKARQRFRTTGRDSCLQRNIVNPQWWKVPVYALISHVNGKPWLKKKEIDEVVRKDMTSDPKADVAADVIRESLVLTELCFFDVDRGMYLFPRALQDDDLVTTDGWPKATVDFGFCPEAAFHRLLVKMYAHGKVLKNNGRRMHRWSVIATESGNESVRVAIVADPENGTLEFRMDPSSDETGRVVLARQLYDIFNGRCMGRTGPTTDAVFKSIRNQAKAEKPAHPKAKPNYLAPDNTWARWNGEVLEFTKTQGKIVRILWNAKKQNNRLTNKEIAYELGRGGKNNSSFRVRDYFEKCKGWKKMIRIEKGKHYLA